MSDPKLTTNYKLYLPISGEKDVADKLNNNLKEIDKQLKLTETDLSTHTHSEFITLSQLAHITANVNEMRSDIATIKAEITTLQTGAVNLNPNVGTGFTVSTAVNPSGDGFLFRITPHPFSHFLFWEIQILKQDTKLYEGVFGVNSIFIDRSLLTNNGVKSGDSLNFRVRAKTIIGTESIWFSGGNFIFRTVHELYTSAREDNTQSNQT